MKKIIIESEVLPSDILIFKSKLEIEIKTLK
jgi:hypothetical protein